MAHYFSISETNSIRFKLMKIIDAYELNRIWNAIKEERDIFSLSLSLSIKHCRSSPSIIHPHTYFYTEENGMMVLQFEWYFKAKTCYIYKNFFLCVNQAFTLQFNDIFVYYVQMNQSVTMWSVVARWIPYRVRSVNWLDWLWRLVSQFVCFNLVRIFEFFLQFANLFSPQMGNGWHHLLRLSNLLIINQTIEQLAYENKHFFKQPETKKNISENANKIHHHLDEMVFNPKNENEIKTRLI